MKQNSKDGGTSSLTPALKVGRVTPGAPSVDIPTRGAHGVTRPTFVGFLLLVLLSLTLSAFAHDPYEISSTVRLETNRTLVEVEMEFNGAMLLAGEPRSREPADQAALFQAKLPELRRQAGQFFEVGSASGAMVATGTNVTLGVENHVKFDLEYPATRAGLKLNATGLRTLSERGPFGVSVTVLDMVNMKVLGQPVLFAHSPAAEFAPAVDADAKQVIQNVITGAPVAAAATTQILAQPEAPAKQGRVMWVFVVLVFFAIVLILLVRRWRAARG